MNEQSAYCKEIKRTSLLVEQIKKEFAQWKSEEPDFDEDFFDEDAVESYLQYLVGYVHKDDWYVIEDRPEKQKKPGVALSVKTIVHDRRIYVRIAS